MTSTNVVLTALAAGAATEATGITNFTGVGRSGGDDDGGGGGPSLELPPGFSRDLPPGLIEAMANRPNGVVERIRETVPSGQVPTSSTVVNYIEKTAEDVEEATDTDGEETDWQQRWEDWKEENAPDLPDGPTVPTGPPEANGANDYLEAARGVRETLEDAAGSDAVEDTTHFKKSESGIPVASAPYAAGQATGAAWEQLNEDARRRRQKAKDVADGAVEWATSDPAGLSGLTSGGGDKPSTGPGSGSIASGQIHERDEQGKPTKYGTGGDPLGLSNGGKVREFLEGLA